MQTIEWLWQANHLLLSHPGKKCALLHSTRDRTKRPIELMLRRFFVAFGKKLLLLSSLHLEVWLLQCHHINLQAWGTRRMSNCCYEMNRYEAHTRNSQYQPLASSRWISEICKWLPFPWLCYNFRSRDMRSVSSAFSAECKRNGTQNPSDGLAVQSIHERAS